MNRKLLWKLCLIFVTGTVAMFYCIDFLTTKTEEDMSMLDQSHRNELVAWGRKAQALHEKGDNEKLKQWLRELEQREQTQTSIVQFQVERLYGDEMPADYFDVNHFGRDVNWKIHLYFQHNPLMEIPFEGSNTSFLITLPERMRPGSYLQSTLIALQIILPMSLLGILCLMIYQHIMQPLSTLQGATKEFTRGDFSVRVSNQLGKRSDEISELANTFDNMAARIGEQIVSQRQLIADLSHELRTPLTRLDIAADSTLSINKNDQNLQRVKRESKHIRRLVEDTLALAWLENERPKLEQESLDLVDLIDVIVEDAKFEFPSRHILATLPEHAQIKHSNHRAVGQALENIIRNALRFTPEGESVQVKLVLEYQHYRIVISDSGLGVPEELLETIFKPFFRVDKSRSMQTNGFGLGLALARRQLNAVGGKVSAQNLPDGGLCMTVILPIDAWNQSPQKPYSLSIADHQTPPTKQHTRINQYARSK